MGLSPVEVNGLQYEISFLLQSGALHSINLLRKEQTSEAGCDSSFDRVLGLLQTDTARQISRQTVRTCGSDNFTNGEIYVRDGGQIATLTNYLSRECLVSVSYTAGGRGSF